MQKLKYADCVEYGNLMCFQGHRIYSLQNWARLQFHISASDLRRYNKSWLGLIYVSVWTQSKWYFIFNSSPDSKNKYLIGRWLLRFHVVQRFGSLSFSLEFHDFPLFFRALDLDTNLKKKRIQCPDPDRP